MVRRIKVAIILLVIFIIPAISFGQAAEETQLKDVFPQASHFEPVKSEEQVLYYKAEDKDGKLLGAVFKAIGKGHHGAIETLAGMTKEGNITAIKVLSQSDTKVLGNRITEESFTGQFRNKNIQDLDNIQAVAGATLSSEAVVNSVKDKAREIKTLLERAN